MKTIHTILNIALVTIVLIGVATVGTAWAQSVGGAHDGNAGAAVSAQVTLPSTGGDSNAAVFYAIAATMGIACLSAAYAVGKVGAAALGAAAEKPELLGKAIVFVGLGEGIAIFGLIISLMLINKI